MITTNQSIVIALAFACFAATGASSEPLALRKHYKGKLVTLTADTDRFAGAISSLRWGEFEFIDSTDHGRELQSAMSFDKLGPCFNPTEAGSQWDSRGPRSSSRVIFARLQTGEIHTKVDAAFWLKPGTPAGQTVGCGWGARPDVQAAVNTTVTGGYLIEKRVRFADHPDNSFHQVVTFTVPASHQEANFDIIAAYLPDRFSEISVFDPSTRTVRNENIFQTHAYVEGPIIFTTVDDKHVLAVVCRAPSIRYIYNRFTHASVVMSNCIQIIHDIKPGRFEYEAQVFFGSKADVANSVAATLAPQGAPTPP